MKRITPIFAALALGLLASLAQARAANPPSPEVVVEDTANLVFSVLRENRERIDSDDEFIYGLVDKCILPLIDFEAMSKLVLGPNWRAATPEQRTRFVNAFRDMLVRTYTTQLVEHIDKRIVVMPGRRPADETIATVNTEIVVGQGKPNVPVSYSMRYIDGRWRVYDLVIEGLSFVKNFRTSFETEIREKGLDALIARLADGNTEAWQANQP